MTETVAQRCPCVASAFLMACLIHSSFVWGEKTRKKLEKVSSINKKKLEKKQKLKKAQKRKTWNLIVGSISSKQWEHKHEKCSCMLGKKAHIKWKKWIENYLNGKNFSLVINNQDSCGKHKELKSFFFSRATKKKRQITKMDSRGKIENWIDLGFFLKMKVLRKLE